MSSKMQVMRIGEAAHREVSMYAAKREKSMAEVGDEIVCAGLAVLTTGKVIAAGLADDERAALVGQIKTLTADLASARTSAVAGKPVVAPDEDRATLLSQALRGLRVEGPDGETGVLGLVDAEMTRWNGTARGKKEPRTRVETVLAAISTAARRYAAANRYGAEIMRQKQVWEGGAKRGKVKVTT